MDESKTNVDETTVRNRSTNATSTVKTTQPMPLWGWGRLHLRDPELRALGYYFRDRAAGPSFSVLIDLKSPLRIEQMRNLASSLGYRGYDTIRLGSHVAFNVEGLSKQITLAKRHLFDTGSSAMEAMILKLTAQERNQLGLPETPEWLAYYI